MMANKKHWLDRFESIKAAILALYIAAILLCVEGIRFLISLFFIKLEMTQIMEFVVPWAIAIILVAALIKGFSNNLKK